MRLMHKTAETMHKNGDILKVGIGDGYNLHALADGVPDSFVAFGVGNGYTGVVDQLETVHGQFGAVVQFVLRI